MIITAIKVILALGLIPLGEWISRKVPDFTGEEK